MRFATFTRSPAAGAVATQLDEWMARHAALRSARLPRLGRAAARLGRRRARLEAARRARSRARLSRQGAHRAARATRNHLADRAAESRQCAATRAVRDARAMRRGPRRNRPRRRGQRRRAAVVRAKGGAHPRAPGPHAGSRGAAPRVRVKRGRHSRPGRDCVKDLRVFDESCLRRAKDFSFETSSSWSERGAAVDGENSSSANNSCLPRFPLGQTQPIKGKSHEQIEEWNLEHRAAPVGRLSRRLLYYVKVPEVRKTVDARTPVVRNLLGRFVQEESGTQIIVMQGEQDPMFARPKQGREPAPEPVAVAAHSPTFCRSGRSGRPNPLRHRRDPRQPRSRRRSICNRSPANPRNVAEEGRR